MDKWVVSSLEDNKKLLPFLKLKYKEKYTLKQLRFSIEHNFCLLNGKIERFASKNVRKGQIVEVEILPHFGFSYESKRLLYEDDYFIAYDKPPFIASTWGLDQVLIPHFGSLFPVHRLDRDTSGILLFAKTKESQRRFEALFRQKLIKKMYHAIVLGAPSMPHGVVEMTLGAKNKLPGKSLWGQQSYGKYSKTFWRCDAKGKHLSLLSCVPITGRTHQIRIHLNHIGHPICGDIDYGGRELPSFLKPLRMMLHAKELIFSHPFFPKRIALVCPHPNDFQEMLYAIELKR